MGFSKVLLFLIRTLWISLLISDGLTGDSDYLAHLGLRRMDFGIGYRFAKVYRAQIELSMDPFDEIPLKTLNCEKYRVTSNSANTGIRSKRAIEGLPEKTCEHPFNGTGGQDESEEEERFWQQLMATNPIPQIYCEIEESDNCILRAIHRPDMSIY